MKLTDARSYLRQVDGQSYSYMKAWGLSIIKEAIRTIYNRKSATDSDIAMADRIHCKIIEFVHRHW